MRKEWDANVNIFNMLLKIYKNDKLMFTSIVYDNLEMDVKTKFDEKLQTSLNK